MKCLSAADYAVDAVTAAKRLPGKWLCRRLPDGSVCKVRMGIAYATKRDQNRRWRFVVY